MGDQYKSDADLTFTVRDSEAFFLHFLSEWLEYPFFFSAWTGIALILRIQILLETGQGIKHTWVIVSPMVRVHLRTLSPVIAASLEASSNTNLSGPALTMSF